MPSPDIAENVQLATEFYSWVKELQKQTPPNPTRPIGRPNHHIAQPDISNMWADLGTDYVTQEPLDAFGATMLMLLENLPRPTGRERWLSLGSGPGIYETFLARIFPEAMIDCLDISPELINFHLRLLAAQTDLAYRVNPQIADISQTLEFPAGSFNRILVINCLHWIRGWRNTISEINRVLSKTEGSTVYSVLGSASVFTDGGRNKLSVTPDLDTDKLTDFMETYPFNTTALGILLIPKGQYGIYTERYYNVTKRGRTPFKHWGRRARKGEIKFIEYTSIRGVVEIRDQTLKTI